MTRHTESATRGERGMTTSEYAVGTIGACSIAYVLFSLASGGFWDDHLFGIIKHALEWRPPTPWLPHGVPLPRIRRP